MNKLKVIKKNVDTGKVVSENTLEFFSVYNAQKHISIIQLQLENELEEIKNKNDNLYYRNKKLSEKDKLPKIKVEVETILELNGVGV